MRRNGLRSPACRTVGSAVKMRLISSGSLITTIVPMPIEWAVNIDPHACAAGRGRARGRRSTSGSARPSASVDPAADPGWARRRPAVRRAFDSPTPRRAQCGTSTYQREGTLSYPRGTAPSRSPLADIATLPSTSIQPAGRLDSATSSADTSTRPPGFPATGGPSFLSADDARSRLLTGMAVAVSEHGYEGTTVADIVRIAHASRRTFYLHFADRAECFLALGDEVAYALGLVATAAARRSWTGASGSTPGSTPICGPARRRRA